MSPAGAGTAPSTVAPAGWREAAVGSLLRTAARRWPDRAALQWPTPAGLGSLTWRQVWRRGVAGALALRAAGAADAPVAIVSPNSVGWYLSLWAVALSARPLVPINPALTAPELATVLHDCGATTVLAARSHRGRDLLAEISALPVAGLQVCDVEDWIPQLTAADPEAGIKASDTFVIQYTSGTTGTPKGAVLSHAACINAATTMVHSWEPRDHDICCSALPLHHISGLIAHALAFSCIGATYVMLDGFSSQQFIDAAAASHATMLTGVPTTYLRLLDDPQLSQAGLADVRLLMLGGASIPPTLVARLEQRFRAPVSVMYGQSEAPAITVTRLDDPAWVKADTVGRALPLREVRIIDTSTGEPAVLGCIGEIQVRTPIKMDRYHNLPEATAAVIDKDGWLHTGDLGHLDAEGLLYFHGRVREVIVRGGENIYPREVEIAVEGHPSVAQVAVIGLPDARWGEVVAAAVVRHPGASLCTEDLSAWVTERLASFKRPTQWRIVDNLPTTASGKPQKFKIAEMLASERDA